MRMLQYENVSQSPVWPMFHASLSSRICAEIRLILRENARSKFLSTLVEFRRATERNSAVSNVFQVARAAVEGRVRKLLITDSMRIFGRINRKNGELNIHPGDLDHVDDDILDDLAQTVLAHGGQVTVASKSDMPQGRHLVALLDEPVEKAAKKSASTRSSPKPVLQERNAI